MTGAPMPEFSDDPVIDFCVKEAIAVSVGAERRVEQKKAERKAWKKGDTSHLESDG